MKKRILNAILYTFLGLSTFSLVSCSKETVYVEKEKITYDANNQIKEKTVYTYDSNGNLIQEDEYEINDSSLTLSYIYKYAYNANGDEILYESYHIDQNDSSIQTLSRKTIKEYDENLLKVETEYDKDNIEYKLEYSYDEKERKLVELKSNYDVDTQEYTKFSTTEYVYDNDFNSPTSTKGYRFTNGIKNSDPMLTTSNIFDDKGNVIYSESEANLGFFSSKDASYYTYNENNKETGYSGYSIDSITGEYVIDSVYNFNYIDGIHRSEAIYQSFDDGVLEKLTRSINEYDENFNLIKSSSYNYNFDSKEFELKEYTTYSYTTI